jgi:hypothetical protein
VFEKIITESETCHIYKSVLLTIKVANYNTYEASKLICFSQHNTTILDVGLLLHERVWTSLKFTVFIFEIDFASLRFSL